MFVVSETDGHCAFQILPQLVTELREINNRPIPFSEEPADDESGLEFPIASNGFKPMGEDDGSPY